MFHMKNVQVGGRQKRRWGSLWSKLLPIFCPHPVKGLFLSISLRSLPTFVAFLQYSFGLIFWKLTLEIVHHYRKDNWRVPLHKSIWEMVPFNFWSLFEKWSCLRAGRTQMQRIKDPRRWFANWLSLLGWKLLCRFWRGLVPPIILQIKANIMWRLKNKGWSERIVPDRAGGA